MAMARISGPVLGMERRTGTGKESGNAYDMTTIRVLVADQDVTEVSTSTKDLPAVSRGDFVDWLVQLDTYRGAPSCRLVSEYPAHATV